MDKSQWYIGTPNGVVLCVNHINGYMMKGYLYHSYSREPTEFSTMDQVIFELDYLYNQLNFPYPTTTERNFYETVQQSRKKGEKVKTMSDKELLSKHGDLGTFIIRVQHRQNSSWQGRITWMDENKTVYFRSIWELVKLIAGALDTVSRPEGEADSEATWKDA